MNILAIFNKRVSKPFMTSLEVIPEPAEGLPAFQSAYSQNPLIFDVKNVSCTQAVFDQIKDVSGTTQAPALIASSESPKFDNRLNVYIQKGDLKIA